MNKTEQAVLRVVLAWTRCPKPADWDDMVEPPSSVEGESKRLEKQRLAQRRLAIWDLGDRIEDLSKLVLLSPDDDDLP